METNPTSVEARMVAILTSMTAVIVALMLLQQRSTKKASSSTYLPSPTQEPAKRAYEVFVLWYSPIWMLAFGVIVAGKFYQDFTATSYMVVCVGLALPLLLQPLWTERSVPLLQRYATKVNIWLAVYSFIGNYWYTHYFYSILSAQYSMPAQRFNNVPIALYFATHFYFSTYHLLSNGLLRKVVTTYDQSWLRTCLIAAVIGSLAYTTAFMESWTLEHYPDYSFTRDRDFVYRIGSAFYALYFVVSFPAFYFDVGQNWNRMTWWDTVVSSCGYGMMILFLLDFVRLYLNVPLTIEVTSTS